LLYSDIAGVTLESGQGSVYCKILVPPSPQEKYQLLSFGLKNFRKRKMQEKKGERKKEGGKKKRKWDVKGKINAKKGRIRAKRAH
jgi:hypothetical protein